MNLESTAKSEVCSLLQEIKQLYNGKPISEQEAILLGTKSSNFSSEEIKRTIMVLPSSGCEWALNSEGGCSMCGHLVGTTKGKTLPKKFQFKKFLEKYNKIDFSETPLLCLYNSGSFLNEKELPSESRNKIYETIRDNKNIKGLIIESRTNYITTEKIQELNEFLSEKNVEIAIGLESSNQEINELIINKNLDLNEFKKAIKLIKQNQLKSLAYVLVKPPFLTEKDAIEDTIKTTEQAFNLGADIISLEPVSVQKFTLTEYLCLNNIFRPAWIWSVIEIVKKIQSKGKIRIGGFEYYPKPYLVTHNCPKCDEKVKKAIEEYNKNYDIKVFDALDCECKKEWQKELLIESEPNISKRIIETLSKIDKIKTFEKMKKKEVKT